jgi:hypothetical protein
VRRYMERIDVRTIAAEDGLSDHTPEQFIWGGRLYVVRQVIDRWSQARPWWRAHEPRRRPSSQRPSSPTSSPQTASLTGPPGYPDPFLDDGVSSSRTVQTLPGHGFADILPDAELLTWRVEASHGSFGAAVVVDLTWDAQSDEWRLERVLD